MKLYDLKTLHMKNAFGIDQMPYFSWKLQSERKNVRQEAYEIVVASGNNVVWNSGKIHSQTTAYITYGGAPLKSGQQYTWTVTSWASSGAAAADAVWESATASATFEMALLEASDWQAKWVSSTLPREPVTQYKYGDTFAPILFKREFKLAKEVARARLYATSYGVYRLTVNGTKPDDREFAPEFTVYDKLLYYQTYDVTDLLAPGENHITMYVGDGWYFSGQAGPVHRLVDKPSILYQLEITYADHTRETIASDGSEVCRTDYILYSDIFQGEMQDLRIKDGQGADGGFRPAAVADIALDNLRAQPMEPVRPMKLLPATDVFKSPAGEWIVDFGQILAGRARIRIDAPKATELTFEYFEILDAQGNYINTMFAPQKDTVISSGIPQVHEALYTFHGFRYIKVTGMDKPSAGDFTAVLLTTQKEDTGTFECSDGRLNRLYENIRWSQRNNMMSIPTDCPSREKAGWTGDILVYARTALLNEDVTPFLTSWIHNCMADQQDDGVVMITTPFASLYGGLLKAVCAGFGDDRITGVAGWSDAIVWVPYEMYRITGNRRILETAYDAMLKWSDYIITTAREKRGYEGFDEAYDQYLWNTGFHFGEWLIPSQGENHGFEICKTSSYYMAPFFGYMTMKKISEIAAVLKDTKHSVYYAEMAEHMKHAIQETLFREDKLPKDLMGAYVDAIAFDLVPDDLLPEYKRRLVTLIHNNGDCLNTGFLATPWLLDALDKVGETELALTLLWQDKMPSWLYEVDRGATCIWEAWEADEAQHNGRFVSFDHYALGCVDDWICRRLCGIDSHRAGFSHIRITPLLDEHLDYCKRSFESEHGRICVAWDKNALKVSIPCNTTATVTWNGNNYEVGSGDYLWTK